MSEQWKYKILNFEVEPPAGAWEKIVSEIKDSNELLPLSQRIYDYEVAPPAIVWKTIATALDTYHEEKDAVPVKLISTRLFRVMAAAAFFGAIILGSFYLYNSGNKKKLSKGK